MNTITLPRSVVEQALEALTHAEQDCADFQRVNTDQTGEAIEALRAALEQEPEAWDNCRGERQCRIWCGNKHCVSHPAPQPPVVEQQSDSDMVSVPRSLLGAACAGMRHRLQDAPKVLEQLRRYTVGDLSKSVVEQPQGEQEPVAWMYVEWSGSGRKVLTFEGPPIEPSPRDEVVNPIWFPLYTSPQPVEQEPICWVTGYYGGRCTVAPCNGATVLPVGMALYTHPQPKREPLTDGQINDHRLALPYDGEDLPDPWDFKQGVKAAERAHGIGGEA